MESERKAQEVGLPGLPSNRWRTQEPKDNSPEGDRNNTKLEARPGVGQEAKREPGQLPEEYKGSDRDRQEPDTNTMRDPQSTTNRSDFHAIPETSAHGRAWSRSTNRCADRSACCSPKGGAGNSPGCRAILRRLLRGNPNLLLGVVTAEGFLAHKKIERFAGRGHHGDTRA